MRFQFNKWSHLAVFTLFIHTSAFSDSVDVSNGTDVAKVKDGNAWQMLVQSGSKVFWTETKEKAEAEIEARKKLAELQRLRGNNNQAMDVTSLASQFEAMGFVRSGAEKEKAPVTKKAKSAKPAKPKFSWQLVSVGRGADGKPYAELKKGNRSERVADGGSLSGWRIDIEADGVVSARNGRAYVAL